MLVDLLEVYINSFMLYSYAHNTHTHALTDLHIFHIWVSEAFMSARLWYLLSLYVHSYVHSGLIDLIVILAIGSKLSLFSIHVYRL